MLAMTDASGRREAFGRAVAEAMAVKGMSQAELARRVGLTQAAISAWTSGANVPDPDTMFRAEKVLELPPGHLSRHLGYYPEPDSERAWSYEDAVMADPLLTEDQKRYALALYREFISKNPRRRRR